MWTAGWTEDEFVAVVEDYEGVGGVGCGDEDDAHDCCFNFCMLGCDS